MIGNIILESWKPNITPRMALPPPRILKGTNGPLGFHPWTTLTSQTSRDSLQRFFCSQFSRGSLSSVACENTDPRNTRNATWPTPFFSTKNIQKPQRYGQNLDLESIVESNVVQNWRYWTPYLKKKHWPLERNNNSPLVDKLGKIRCKSAKKTWQHTTAVELTGRDQSPRLNIYLMIAFFHGRRFGGEKTWDVFWVAPMVALDLQVGPKISPLLQGFV